MSKHEDQKLKFVWLYDCYIVRHDGDRIGFVKREDDRRWKAVDTYMAWTRKYATRTQAAAALLRRWRKNPQ